MGGGLFVAFEGGDGAGKSTQAALLASRLERGGFDVVLTREPGDSSIGPALREVLLSRETAGVAPRAEALLYAADRAQHVSEVVRPALMRGAVVVTDRYVDSSVAYQGGARALGAEAVEALSDFATEGLTPDLTVLLDLDPAAAAARRDAASRERDRIEAEPADFHHRVRAAFLARAEQAPSRYAVVDAAGPAEQVAERVAAAVHDRLPPTRGGTP